MPVPLGIAIGALALGGMNSIMNHVGNRDAVNAANEQNLRIARETNDTNIQNTRDTNQTILQSGRETNDANIKIAQQQNATNLQLAEADRQFRLQQWQRENEYNSPAAQAARFRAAGLNPSLAQGDSGNAGSLQLNQMPEMQAPQLLNPASGISVPTASATATMVAPQSNIDLGFGQLLNVLNEYEDYKGKAIDNHSRPSMNDARLKGLGFDNDIKKSNVKLLDETINDRIVLQHAQMQEAIYRTAAARRADELGEKMQPSALAHCTDAIELLHQNLRSARNANNLDDAVVEFRKQSAKWDAQQKEYAAQILEMQKNSYTDLQALGVIGKVINLLLSGFNTYSKFR